VELVPTTNIVLNWATARSEAHKLDEKLSTISVRSVDGFTFNLDVSQIIHIPRADAPKVIARFGNIANLVTQVLEPTIGNYFRNTAQGSDVIDFLKGRAQRQADARTCIGDALREYNVVALDTTAPMDSVDWRTKGAVTPIKNQGQCGSCWAFSTTGSVEGAYFISTGKLVSLSEQQLVDCSGAYGNEGCNGGLMDDAFKYIIANGGLDTESDYAYTARDGVCNKAKAAIHAASIKSFADVPANQEAQLIAAVAKTPVSVAIEADQSGFQFYKSGVFAGPCGTQLDHGVLAVGYDTTATTPYWIVKNSWGTSWGDQGYIMMAQGKGAHGLCGINMMASYPTA